MPSRSERGESREWIKRRSTPSEAPRCGSRRVARAARHAPARSRRRARGDQGIRCDRGPVTRAPVSTMTPSQSKSSANRAFSVLDAAARTAARGAARARARASRQRRARGAAVVRVATTLCIGFRLRDRRGEVARGSGATTRAIPSGPARLSAPSWCGEEARFASAPRATVFSRAPRSGRASSERWANFRPSFPGSRRLPFRPRASGCDFAMLKSHWLRRGGSIFAARSVREERSWGAIPAFIPAHTTVRNHGCRRFPQRQRRLQEGGARQEGARQEGARQEGARAQARGRRRQALRQHRPQPHPVERLGVQPRAPRVPRRDPPRRRRLRPLGPLQPHGVPPVRPRLPRRLRGGQPFR